MRHPRRDLGGRDRTLSACAAREAGITQNRQLAGNVAATHRHQSMSRLSSAVTLTDCTEAFATTSVKPSRFALSNREFPVVHQRAWVAPLGALWTVKSDARQVITAYETFAEAVQTARSLLAATGGGELVIKDSTGSVTSTESVAQQAIQT